MKKKLGIQAKILKSVKDFRLILLFLSFFFLFGALGITIVNTYDHTQEKDKQLAILQDEVIKEKANNDQLKQQKTYYSSDGYIEKEARNLLGLSYPNEQIYILKNAPLSTNMVKDSVSPNLSDSSLNSNENFNNLQKWMNLIFGH